MVDLEPLDLLFLGQFTTVSLRVETERETVKHDKVFLLLLKGRLMTFFIQEGNGNGSPSPLGLLVNSESNQHPPDPFIISKSRQLNKRVTLNVGGVS